MRTLSPFEKSEMKTCNYTYISGSAESRGKRLHDILREGANSSMRVEFRLQDRKLEREGAKKLLG